MKISELASQTGVSAHRLRHYEALGLIKAKRNSSGYRVFAEGTQREVAFIAKCREVRIPLDQIAKVLPGYRAGTLTFDDMVELMEDQIKQVDQQLADLRALRHELVSASGWFKRKKRQHAQRAGQRKPGSTKRTVADD